MAEMTGRDLHVDQLLTNISIAYQNGMYIADSIAPLVPVAKQSNIIPNYDQSHWFRNTAQLRAPGTQSERGWYAVSSTNTYFCRRFSFGFEIPDELRDNTDAPYDLDRDGTEFVTDKLLMYREVNAAATFFTTSVWGADKVGGTDFVAWSTYATSDPLVNLYAYMDEVEGRIGREANTLVLGKQTWVQLRWHPDLLDTIKYVQVGVVTEQMLASLLGLNKLLIGRSIYTTSPEGTAEGSVTYTRIWGKHGLLLYVPEQASLLRPAACYTFAWNRVPNAISYIKRIREESRELDVIEGNSYFDQKLTASRAGVFIQNAVA